MKKMLGTLFLLSTPPFGWFVLAYIWLMKGKN